MNFKNIIRRNATLFKLMKHVFLRVKYVTNIKKVRKYKVQNKPDIEISAPNMHCFFGYYDKSPWNRSMSYIIYNSIHKDIPEAININVYNLETKEHTILDETKAWNWQQGSMLQWTSEIDVIYNIYDPESQRYKAKSHNIKTGDCFLYELPIYAKGKKSDVFLSLNFTRLQLLAKGYGYNTYQEISLLPNDQDGIWMLNMKTNAIELILTINELVNYKPRSEFLGAKHYINHVEYCADDKSCIFIHRWSQNQAPFKSRLFIFDIDSKTLRLLLDNNHVSHFCWKDESELLIYATKDNKEKGYFLINVETGFQSEIYKGMPEEDGHPSYSPDKKFILTDIYPDASRNQSLFLYESSTGNLKTINSFYSPFSYFDDYRCDLHPRWSPDGQYVSVDTTYSGLRSLSIFKI
jgi:hypothetical protein